MLAEFDEQALADALEEEGDRQAAVDNDDEGSVWSQDNISGVSGGSVGGIEELNEDKKEEVKVKYLIVCSQRYKQALAGMKVHDAGVQGKMGGPHGRGPKGWQESKHLGQGSRSLEGVISNGGVSRCQAPPSRPATQPCCDGSI